MDDVKNQIINLVEISKESLKVMSSPNQIGSPLNGLPEMVNASRNINTDKPYDYRMGVLKSIKGII